MTVRLVRTTGRPTKFASEIEEKILEALRGGNTRSAAAEAAGIGRSTMCTWVASGRRGEQPFQDFVNKIERAEAEAEKAVVKALRKAIDSGNVTAMVAWLERRRPKAWSRKPELIHGKFTLPDPATLSPSQLQVAIASALEARARLAGTR